MRTIRSIALAGSALVLATASVSAQSHTRAQPQSQSNDLCQIVVNGYPYGRPMRCDVAQASAPRNSRIVYAGTTVSQNQNRDWAYQAEQQRAADRSQRDRLERDREQLRIEQARIQEERIERQREQGGYDRQRANDRDDQQRNQRDDQQRNQRSQPDRSRRAVYDHR